MEVPRLAHDELLHGLHDETQDPNVRKVLESVERVIHVIEVEQQERHPLLLGKDSTSKKQHGPTKKKQHITTPQYQQSTWVIAREEAWLLLQLSIPMMLAALLEMLPQTILTMMLGHTSTDHSTQALAAFGLAGLFQLLLIGGVLNGIAAAIDTLCSQAFGADRLTEMWMFCQAGLVLYGACLPFVITILLCGAPILKFLGQEPSIAMMAGTVLAIMATSMPSAIVFSVIKSGLQAQNIAFPFVLTTFVASVVSIGLAYVLAFSCELGYVGIALATPILWTLKALALIPVVLQNRAFQQAWPGIKWKEAMMLLPKIAHLGVSSILMVIFQMLGFSTISLLAGLLPNAAVTISANGIFASMLGLASMPLLGICVAGAIRMGNALGAGDFRRASILSRMVMVFSSVVATCTMLVFTQMANWYAHCFTSDVTAIALATQLIERLWPLIPLMGVKSGLQSVFRACGKQLVCAQYNFACLFVVGVPCGLLLAIKCHTGLLGLWYGNVVGLLIFIGAGWRWLHQLHWESMAEEATNNTQVSKATANPPAKAY